MDRFSFAHQPMSGDGTVVARVVAQDDSHPWAKAGIMIKDGLTSGSPYAAIMVTPGHGVRWEADFTTDVAGSPDGAPRWLKLTRSGQTISGYESIDGNDWHQVGAIVLDRLPPTVEVGMFVSSPLRFEYEQGGGARRSSVTPTTGVAVFDSVHGSPVSATGWTYTPVAPVPVDGEPQLRPGPGGLSGADGTFTVTGDGDIAWYGIPSFTRPDARDLVSDSLQGVQIGLLAMIVLGVLAAAGEYKTGMIRATLAATPRRGRLLAAKATVLGAVVFIAGLIAGAVAFLMAQPILRDRGMRPPAYAYRSLWEADVLRAVIGTAAFLALLAVFALAVGMLLRRASYAIPVMIALILVPQLAGGMLSLEADMWLDRLTPAAGLAIQQTVVRFDTAINPWGGLAVLTAYTMGSLALALWLFRRRNA
jgi:ABC-type transport system involved in multi-copper enzyme maturation permease subunit